jgi:hypothetical protein
MPMVAVMLSLVENGWKGSHLVLGSAEKYLPFGSVSWPLESV